MIDPWIPTLLASASPDLVPAGVSLWSFQSAVALLTLTALEIVLGIDNVIFIAILAAKLPPAQQDRARRAGIAAAVISRVLLLLSLSWLMGLTRPLFALLGHDFSGKDLILLLGGLFLLGKSTFEIHDKLEGTEHGPTGGGARATFGAVVFQIMLLDVVFSLDSVITAVGMSNQIVVMIAAVMIAAAIMLLFSGAVARFVEKRPTMKMLALAFLLLIGVTLVADGLGQHINKGYIYFAMAFSFGVEILNQRLRTKVEPVQLRHSSLPDGDETPWPSI